uniref:NAD(P)-binding protein n=1 Tax=Mycena chlorophos TaxID=658473 RepID=A0ABQ0MBS1_MYCCL|nr:predicted protein [Mycena chlorophos]
MSSLFGKLRYLFFNFLPDQFFSKIPETHEDLRGRTYIVTGSNVGLGLAAATHLARMKPDRLILAVRDVGKGEAAKAEIVAETGYEGKLEVWVLDMGSWKSVKAFAERANNELERLDGALLNAGLNTPKWQVTGDGWENILQVNTLATGLLGVLLLPILQKTAGLPTPLPDAPKIAPHLTMTGSAAQFFADFPEMKLTSNLLKTLNDESKCKHGDRYPISKLLLNLQTRKIAQLPAAKDVVVNVTDPGLCITSIGRDFELKNWVLTILNFVAWSAPKGAWNMIWTLLKPTPPGAWTSSCEVRKDIAWSYTKDAERVQELLWAESVELWTGVAPNVAEIVKTA